MRQLLDPFLIGIVFCVALAYWFSEITIESTGVVLDHIASVGIGLIFFFYGVKLNFKKMKSDLGNWKLHLLIQGITFLVFPLLILPFYKFFQSESLYYLWLGFFFLAALPSTVSSSVVMVSIGKGNIPAAIFNASISGLIGVMLTPLWLSFFIPESSSDFKLSKVYWQLLTEILLPVIFGLFFNSILGNWANRYKNALSWFDKSVILLIIFKSFGRSFQSQLFNTVEIKHIISVGIGVVALFVFVLWFSAWMSKRLHFSSEDQITAQFCGTKKSLVHGSVFAKILLPASLPLGLILLPIMVYHALQLFVIGYLANQKAIH